MLKQIKAPFNLNWLQDDTLQKLLSIFNNKGEEARIVGGAIRNALLNKPITDIDIATTATPENIILYAKQAGFKAIKTGIEHGTITIIANSQIFEVTTLREDTKTDGRHAIVKFTKDWKIDAQRRDFTINALYLDVSGIIYDYVNGLEDIELKKIKFIGTPALRIQEDYLRILRFFRFYAYYGEGAPNKEDLLNCVAYKNGLKKISSERIWTEFKKILIAPNPLRAMLWLRKTDILNLIIPQSEKWGIDLLPKLIEAEQKFNWHIKESPFLRLQAIIPPRPECCKELAKHLNLSKKELNNLIAWAKVPILKNDFAINKFLFLYGKIALIDNLKLLIAQYNNKKHLILLNKLQNANMPIFPILGKDLLNLGATSGKILGDNLKKLEELWLESDCKLSKAELLDLFVMR